MKIAANEYDETIHLDIEPETLADAILLVRLGMNATAKVIVHTYAFRKSGISTTIVIDKRKKGRISI